ncbi:MAG: hypothetical protein U5K76_06335 [Woeseiaceae bacterium]|nr:hypothetical protein [Woeseiaceae bacterium]
MLDEIDGGSLADGNDNAGLARRTGTVVQQDGQRLVEALAGGNLDVQAILQQCGIQAVERTVDSDGITAVTEPADTQGVAGRVDDTLQRYFVDETIGEQQAMRIDIRQFGPCRRRNRRRCVLRQDVLQPVIAQLGSRREIRVLPVLIARARQALCGKGGQAGLAHGAQGIVRQSRRGLFDQLGLQVRVTHALAASRIQS